MKEFLTAFYGFAHVTCGGRLAIDKVGVNEHYKLVILGTCTKCGEADVATLIPLRSLKTAAQTVKASAKFKAQTSKGFSIKDIADFKRFGITIPPEQKLLKGGDL